MHAFREDKLEVTPDKTTAILQRKRKERKRKKATLPRISEGNKSINTEDAHTASEKGITAVLQQAPPKEIATPIRPSHFLIR